MTNETKITIDVFENVKGTIEKTGIKEVVIKPMKPYQFFSVAKKLKELINELNADENISGALVGLFDGYEEGMATNELLSNLSAQFIKDSAGSLGLLLEVAPEKAFELVAILAEVDEGQLQLQEMDVFFDIIDAVADVNDLSKVVERAKKSTKKFQASLKWGQKVAQATSLTPVK